MFGLSWPVLVVGAGLLAFCGLQTVRLSDEESDHADTKVVLANTISKHEREAREASDKALAESEVQRLRERAREASKNKEIERAEAIATQERADRVIADATAGRLLGRINALVAAAREASGNPKTGEPGATATDAIGVLADVQGKCIARVRLLADLADQRGNAGRTCEKLYDSLEQPIQPGEAP